MLMTYQRQSGLLPIGGVRCESCSTQLSNITNYLSSHDQSVSVLILDFHKSGRIKGALLNSLSLEPILPTAFIYPLPSVIQTQKT